MQCDAWSAKCEQVVGQKTCGFSDNFVANMTERNLSLDEKEYTKKLEQKLQRLQNEKQKVSGKIMLEHLKEKREFHMNELMNGLDVYTDSSAAGSPSFMDKLYSTNSLYRHLNPQQALDASEKEPFVEHDQLATKHVES